MLLTLRSFREFIYCIWSMLLIRSRWTSKVDDIQPFATQLHLVDSNALLGDEPIRPNIAVYHHTTLGGEIPSGYDLSRVDMHIESNRQHDIFCPYFSGASYCEMLAPVWHRIAAQFTAQAPFRTYCFYVLITGPHARIMLWDRSNVVVTERIEYNSDDSLVEFFSRFSQAPPGLRGVDTSWRVQPQAPNLLSASPSACQEGKTTSVRIYPALGEPVSDFTSSRELVQAIHDALVGGSCPSSSVRSPTLPPIPSTQRGIRARISPLGLYPLEHQHHPRPGLSDRLGPGETYRHKAAQSGHTHGVQPYLSTLCRVCVLTSLRVQDITAFLSVRHVNDRDRPPTLQDDLESAFWVLLWIALAYLDSSLCQWELHRFMAATLGRKSDVDDFIQKSVVANKLSGRGLFLDYPLLKCLLLDLA